MTDSLRFKFSLVDGFQDDVPFDENFARLDSLLHLTLSSISESAPPAAPAEGACWLVGPAPTGDWSDHEGEIAMRRGSSWLFAAPVEGLIAYVSDENAARIYDGALWAPFVLGDGVLAPALALLEPLTPAADQLAYYASGSAAALTTLSATGRGIIGASTGLSAREFLNLGVVQNVEFGGLGLGGASPDATNRLAVASPAVLFTHAGAGVQFKVNKAAAAQTASLLFQTNWSGRAEMGLNGSDDWSLKTSANGSAWINALTVAAATGEVSLHQDLGLAHGGTGASTAAGARTNLGAASQADFERSGSGNLLEPISDKYASARLILPGAGDYPAGATGTVLEYVVPPAGSASFRWPILPLLSGAALFLARAQGGDAFLLSASARILSPGAVLTLRMGWRVGTSWLDSTTVGAASPGGAFAALRGVARIPESAAADGAEIFINVAGAPGDKLQVCLPYFAQLVGWQAGAALQRAATPSTSVSAAPQYAGQQAQVGGAVYIATGTASAADWRPMAQALRSYTVATLPSASPAAQQVYVSNGASNKRLAISDGSAWRWPDGAVVS